MARQFTKTLLDVLDEVSYRRVPLQDPSDPIFKFRYDAYRREEFIPFNSLGVAGDDYDLTPNASCFGVYLGDKLAGSVRLHHVTPECRDSPSRTIYPDELGAMLDGGKTYIDPSRFTADYETTLAFPALPFLTLRLAAMACEYFRADYCLSSVRKEHGAFYRRVFGSVQMGGEKFYKGLDFPVFLYVAEVPKIRDNVADRYPFMMSTPEERRALFEDGVFCYGRHIKPTARQEIDRVTEAKNQLA